MLMKLQIMKNRVAKAQDVLAKIAVEENKVSDSKVVIRQQEEQRANYQNYILTRPCKIKQQQTCCPELVEKKIKMG